MPTWVFETHFVEFFAVSLVVAYGIWELVRFRIWFFIAKSHISNDEIKEDHVPEDRIQSQFLQEFGKMDEEGTLDTCLPFFNAPIYAQYQVWQQNAMSFRAMLFAWGLCGGPHILGRFSLAFLIKGIPQHPLIVCSQIMLIPVIGLFLIFFSCLIFMSKYGDKKKLQLDKNITLESNLTERGRYIRDICQYLLLYGHLQDLFMYSIAVSNSFNLLGRVLTGQCPENTSLFMSQRCNPLADRHGIPFEIVLMMYGAPLICHVIFRGTSIWSVLISIVTCCCAIVASLIIVDGWLQMYIVFNSLVFMSIVVEMERWMRIAFIRRQLLLETTSLKLVIQHQMLEQKENEVKMLAATNDARLAAKEQEQMRSIMGNVAHDLKTPLHSITAEIDFLRHTANKAHQQAASLHASAMLIQHQHGGAGMWVPTKTADNTSNIKSLSLTADTTRTTSVATSQSSSATASAYASLAASKSPSASSLFTGANDNHGDDSDTDTKLLLSSSLTAQGQGPASVNPMAVLDSWISETNPVLDSLDNTVTFLVMAINRSQDYVKASGNIELTPIYETFSMVEILATVKKVMDNQNAGRFVNVYPPVDMSPTLISDKHYLTENLLCLVSNASKYSDKGATIDVRVKLDRSGEYQRSGTSVTMPVTTSTSTLPLMVLVTVQDTGIGISDEAKTALFQPFKQAQRRAGGTGLGLYSLAKRMDALGGSCGVRDRDDGQQGSVFWFTFPYRPDVCTTPPNGYTSTPPMIAASLSPDTLINTAINSDSIAIGLAPHPIVTDYIATSTPAATSPSPSPVANVTVTPGSSPSSCAIPPTSATGTPLPTLPPLRVLLTDDSASILRVTKRFLTSNGHTVETCENGNQSLERLKAGPDDFDLLITDLQMPVMDGFESVTRYRAFEQTLLPRTKRLFIMGMSANNDAQSRAEALATGMDVFVAKPFTYGNLVNILIGTKLGEAVVVKNDESMTTTSS